MGCSGANGGFVIFCLVDPTIKVFNLISICSGRLSEQLMEPEVDCSISHSWDIFTLGSFQLSTKAFYIGHTHIHALYLPTHCWQNCKKYCFTSKILNNMSYKCGCVFFVGKELYHMNISCWTFRGFCKLLQNQKYGNMFREMPLTDGIFIRFCVNMQNQWYGQNVWYLELPRCVY